MDLVIEALGKHQDRARFSCKLIRRGERLVARPRVDEGERTEIDVARLIEEERDRWPG